MQLDGVGRMRRACSLPTSCRQDRLEPLIKESADVQHETTHGQDDGRDKVIPRVGGHPVGEGAGFKR